MSKSETPAIEELRARVIRPAMRHLVAHTLDERQVHIAARRSVFPDSADAAHKDSG